MMMLLLLLMMMMMMAIFLLVSHLNKSSSDIITLPTCGKHGQPLPHPVQQSPKGSIILSLWKLYPLKTPEVKRKRKTTDEKMVACVKAVIGEDAHVTVQETAKLVDVSSGRRFIHFKISWATAIRYVLGGAKSVLGGSRCVLGGARSVQGLC